MRKLFAAALVAISAVGASMSAEAMPVAPLSSDGAVIQVAGGCGAGFHRGRYGGCRPNARRVIVAPRVVAPVVVARPVAVVRPVVVARPVVRLCPRGFHRGPGGRCIR